MEPKIIFDKEFKLAGLRKFIEPESESFPDLWGEFFSRRHEIKNEVNSAVALGVTEYNPAGDGNGFYYIACAEVIAFDDIPEGMTSKKIPPTKYAVFTHKGTMLERNNTYDFIYMKWLPSSGYELGKTDTIELYDSRSEDLSSPDCEFDIYIPLK